MKVKTKLAVKNILDELTKAHGDETFVADGYAYYDDALVAFSKLIDAQDDQLATLREALKRISSMKFLRWHVDPIAMADNALKKCFGEK